MALRPLAAAPLLALLVTSAQEPVPPAVRYEQHIFAGGNPPPAGTLQNPFKGDKQSAADGEQLFGLFNCDGCHGGGADGEVFHSISYGRARGMPAFGGILPPDAIWKLVTYLQSLEPKQDISTVSW